MRPAARDAVQAVRTVRENVLAGRPGADQDALDRAAALDPVNERIVARWIASLSGRATLLVVAHQLHTIAAADQIVVLGEDPPGRVLERGTHDELMALDGHYSRMWRIRTEAAGWRLTRL